jgi:NAD(P)-dependent dehydrogenase (short-subunit alcohol dehydrogenase family)
MDKIIIITGGTGALGRYVVDKFAREGWKIYLPVTSLKKFMEVFDNSQDANSSFALRRIYAFECDAVNENSVNEFIKKVAALEKGKIDMLVNTVGGFHEYIDVSEFETNVFDLWFNLNFKSTFYFSKKVLKVMRENNYGRIVSISSLAGLNPMPGRLAYSVSKSAVIELMETINIENENTNIKCNAIIPTTIDTPSNREWGSEEEIIKWVKPEAIANMIYGLTLKDEPTILKIGN